jgi:hypothetical protein
MTITQLVFELEALMTMVGDIEVGIECHNDEGYPHNIELIDVRSILDGVKYIWLDGHGVVGESSDSDR